MTPIVHNVVVSSGLEFSTFFSVENYNQFADLHCDRSVDGCQQLSGSVRRQLQFTLPSTFPFYTPN